MKKVLALVLASAMALGMTVTAFAASSAGKINGSALALVNGYDQGLGNSGTKTGAPKGKYTESGDTITYGENVVPHDKIKDYISLYEEMFDWSDYTPTANTLLTAAQIRTGKLAVRTSVKAGSKALDNISIDTKKGRIELKYLEEWVNTGDMDFDITVFLTIDGKRQDDYSLTITGTMKNELIEVFEDDDYVDLGNGQVAEAMDFIGKMEADLGNGVSIFTKFFKGKKYYGTAKRDSDAADDVVFTKYPDIDNVVTLNTVGLNSTGDIVQLDTDYSDYYVYDKDMNYLGQSSVMLPYSTKYYLANKKLDVTSDDDTDVTDVTDEPSDAGDDEDATGGNPNMGGDEGVANNANANPGTGR